MRYLSFFSALGLSFLLGVCLLLTRPEAHRLAWANQTETLFRISVQIQYKNGKPLFRDFRTKASETLLHLSKLKGLLGKNVLVYTVPRLLMGSVMLEGKSFDRVADVVALGDYFPGRKLQFTSGRAMQNPKEVVLGYSFAQRLVSGGLTPLGQTLKNLEGQTYRVVGTLAPSSKQDEFVDPDKGYVHWLNSKEPELKVLPMSLDILAPANREVDVERSIRGYIKSNLSGYQLTKQDRKNNPFSEISTRIDDRRLNLTVFGGLVTLGGLLTLWVSQFSQLLRRRLWLGVDKALGASTGRMLVQMVLPSVLPTVWGSAVGTIALHALPRLGNDIFIGEIPVPIQILAFGVPVLFVVVLVVFSARSLVTQSSYHLLRSSTPSQHLWRLYALVYIGFGLGLGAVLTTLTVWSQVQDQVKTLENQFSSLYALETSNQGLDLRREGTLSLDSTSARLTEREVSALVTWTGVEQPSLAQTITVGMSLRGKTITTPKGMAASAAFYDLLHIRLLQGNRSGCVLTLTIARQLNAQIGDVLKLEGLSGPLPCVLSGISAPVDALYPWLIADFPQVITPTLSGLGPSIEDARGRNMVPTDQFRSTRILFRLSPGSKLEQVQSRFQLLNPALHFQIVRYAPGAERALENLRWQAQLFLGLAVLSCVLSAWGLISGFLALLDAQRYRLALERVIGLDLLSLQRQWWIQTLVFCGISGILGSGLALLLSTPLYNAFGLEVPGGEPGNILPLASFIQTREIFYISLVAVLILLASVLVKIGVVYIKSQSVPRLLKEGA